MNQFRLVFLFPLRGSLSRGVIIGFKLHAGQGRRCSEGGPQVSRDQFALRPLNARTAGAGQPAADPESKPVDVKEPTELSKWGFVLHHVLTRNACQSTSMGAWGIHTFENDGALDWLGGFLDAPSEKRITDTFSPVDGRLPGWIGRLFGRKPQHPPIDLDGEDVLAAAEVVATILGRPSGSNPNELDNPPDLALGPETVAHAKFAIDSILRSSHLRDCWEETDDYESWKATVENLRQRLDSA